MTVMYRVSSGESCLDSVPSFQPNSTFSADAKMCLGKPDCDCFAGQPFTSISSASSPKTQ